MAQGGSHPPLPPPLDTYAFNASTIVTFIKHNIMLYKIVLCIYKLESRGDSVSHRPLSMYNITTLLLNQSSIECVLLTFVYSKMNCIEFTNSV